MTYCFILLWDLPLLFVTACDLLSQGEMTLWREGPLVRWHFQAVGRSPHKGALSQSAGLSVVTMTLTRTCAGPRGQRRQVPRQPLCSPRGQERARPRARFSLRVENSATSCAPPVGMEETGVGRGSPEDCCPCPGGPRGVRPVEVCSLPSHTSTVGRCPARFRDGPD